MKVSHALPVVLCSLGLVTLLGFQNCGTPVTLSGAAESASKTPSTSQPAAVTPPSASPAPVPPQPNNPPPQTYKQVNCPQLSLTVPCPDGRANCTCTDTIPAGTYLSGEWSRAPLARVSNHGPNCFVPPSPDQAMYASHSGTVVEPRGVCLNYCSILARCVDGQWVETKVTW